MASPPPLDPVIAEAEQQVTGDQGGEVVAEEGHPPEAAPGSEEPREVEVVRKLTTGPGEASTGGTGSERVIFGDCGPIKKL